MSNDVVVGFQGTGLVGLGDGPHLVTRELILLRKCLKMILRSPIELSWTAKKGCLEMDSSFLPILLLLQKYFHEKIITSFYT